MPTLEPSRDVLAKIGRNLRDAGAAPSEVEPAWMRGRLAWETRDDSAYALSDAAAIKLMQRACALAEAPTRTDGPAQLPRIWIDDAAFGPNDGPRWLLKGLLGEQDLAVVYGPPGCGKTFFVIDLVGSLAARLEWRGRRRPGPGLYVYVAPEAGRSILRRFIAWRDLRVGEAREERLPLAIVPTGPNLLHANEVEELVHELRKLAAEAGVPLRAVVFDTLSRSMPGGDENSAQDVTRVIAAADRIRHELGATVILIHHSGKDSTKGARGHSALVAAADTVIAVDARVATFEKVRDGVANLAFAFDLEVVELGKDEDGDPVTTCVVVPIEGAAAAAMSGPRLAGLGRNQETGLKVLGRLYARARKTLAERGDDPASACILTAGWKTELEERHDINRFRFRELAKVLQQRNLIRVDGPHVYLTEEP